MSPNLRLASRTFAWVVWAVLATVPLSAQQQFGSLAVLVEDSAGRPVSGVEIVVDGAEAAIDLTDIQGKVVFPVGAGEWRVIAWHSQFVLVPTVQQVSVRPGSPAAIRFQSFQRTARIVGTIRFASDPPPGVSVGGVTGTATDSVNLLPHCLSLRG